MFVNHIFATGQGLLPPGPYMYEYVVAGNGIFVRARRADLEAMIPVSRSILVKGLEPVTPYVRLQSKVPAALVRKALLWSVEALPKEVLFWFAFDAANNTWTICKPKQYQTRTSVKPMDPYDAFGSQALIDLHSHNTMSPFFSSQDNRDETGFRIYAVIGSIDIHCDIPPAIQVRVGIYGHFWTIPAAQVFNLPVALQDVNLLPESYFEESEEEVPCGIEN